MITQVQESINNFTGSCFDVSYADYIAEMKNSSLQSDVAGTPYASSSDHPKPLGILSAERSF